MTRAVAEPIIRTRRWTRQEYDRLIELGVLREDEPIELLAGCLVVREPQHTPHATATQLATESTRRTTVLVVEVAHASLRADRTLKARLYARAGVGDYWIVNLVDRVLEVHRSPTGPRPRPVYADIRRIDPSASIAPLAAPTARIVVADLLP